MPKKDKITEFINEKIKLGEYKPGTKIMSEPLLAKYLNVSRNTVREAIGDLTEKGVLIKKPGSGTYIKDNYKTKYVVVSVKKSYFMFEIDTFFKRLVEDITRLVEKNGYKVYVNIESGLEEKLILPISLDDIAGFISMNGNENRYSEIEKKKIPIVSLFNRNSIYPSVTRCFNDFYIKLDKLIKDNNFKNIVFFNYDRQWVIDDDYLIDYSIYRYYSDKYKFININQSSRLKDITVEIESFFNEIKEPVDAIVYLYDTLYVHSQVLFSKYDWIKHTKIITHSNNDETYLKEYKICRLTYEIKDFSENIVKFLIKLINNEKIIHTAYHVKCKIIGEENLKKEL